MATVNLVSRPPKEDSQKPNKGKKEKKKDRKYPSCDYFNKGKCFKGDSCDYPHVCSVCGKGHTEVDHDQASAKLASGRSGEGAMASPE